MSSFNLGCCKQSGRPGMRQAQSIVLSPQVRERVVRYATDGTPQSSRGGGVSGRYLKRGPSQPGRSNARKAKKKQSVVASLFLFLLRAKS